MTIPIFYSISDDFTKYAAVSLNSLVKHTDPNKDYTVYFLNQDLSSKHQKALSDLSSSNVHVKFSILIINLYNLFKIVRKTFFALTFLPCRFFIASLFQNFFPNMIR